MAATDHGVEGALEELYASDPAQFTKTRDRLAKDLAAAGDAEGAAAIKSRRKPTQIAWVLNTLTRKHPDDIADLVDIGRELAREQRKALRGEAATGLRASIERQRKAILALAQKTSALMKDLGVDPGHLDEVTSALHAAVADPIVGAQVEEARLDRAPEAAVGFGAPMASPPAAAKKEAREEKEREARAAAKDGAAAKKAAAKVAREEKREREARTAAKEAAAKAAREEKAAAAKAREEEKAAAAKVAREEKVAAAREMAAKVRAGKERAAHAKALAVAKAEANVAAAAATKAQRAAERAEKEARAAIERAKELASKAADLGAAAEASAKAVTRLEANAPT
ncbi:MAG: hypothetical protein KIT84_00165 [Labilithrix sp.]|nr:hypothetical protein [Labilithrix sp.]MCW5809396.1 hypothetical protein [Labilithrix sp.]